MRMLARRSWVAIAGVNALAMAALAAVGLRNSPPSDVPAGANQLPLQQSVAAVGPVPAQPPLTGGQTLIDTAASVGATTVRKGPRTITHLQPHTFRIDLPASSALSQGQARLILRLAVSAYRPSTAGATEFRVELKGGSSRVPAHVGYFSMFPVKAFEATGSDRHKSFAFDLTGPMADLAIAQGPVDVIVSAERHRAPVDGAGVSDSLTIDHIELEVRKAAQ